MVDYAPDWMIGFNGYTNPLIYYGSRVEAAAMGRAGDSEYINTLVMNNSRAYLHGYVDGVWDYTLGGIESGIESYFNERLEMKEYVRDTFSGKNDEPWFMQARKMGAIGIQYTTGLPTYSMVGMQEDANRMVVDTAYTVTQMNMQDWINLGFAPAKLVYDKGVYFYHCLQSEEAMEGLYYGGGYVAGTTTGIAVDAIVGDVAASKAMSLGQRAIGKLSKINLRGVEVLDDVTDTSRIADRTTDVIEGGTSTFKYKEIKTFTADETNQWFIDNVKPDYKPPYKPGTIVKEIELTENTTFVRVDDNMPDGSGMYGSWVMKAEDIEGLTPLEIQNKFALPNTPKYVCDVELEAGTHIRVGEVNPLEGWGSGGGTQYDLIGQRIGDFKNERLLEGN